MCDFFCVESDGGIPAPTFLEILQLLDTYYFHRIETLGYVPLNLFFDFIDSILLQLQYPNLNKDMLVFWFNVEEVEGNLRIEGVYNADDTATTEAGRFIVYLPNATILSIYNNIRDKIVPNVNYYNEEAMVSAGVEKENIETLLNSFQSEARHLKEADYCLHGVGIHNTHNLVRDGYVVSLYTITWLERETDILHHAITNIRTGKILAASNIPACEARKSKSIH